ncbi:MAG: hypothetical protein LBB93_00570 [Elusimicrobiota bacterium]|jgi:hypothetical protein|nr:hypothetical protein [Elusimicrobiota bacterium]
MKKLVFVFVFGLIAGVTSSVYAQTVPTKIEPEPQMRPFEFLTKISLGVVNSLSQQMSFSVPKEFENSGVSGYTDSATENISLLGPTFAFELYAWFFGVGTSFQLDNNVVLQDLNDKVKMGFTNLYFSLKPPIYSSKDGYLYFLGQIGISIMRENYGEVLEATLRDEFRNASENSGTGGGNYARPYQGAGDVHVISEGYYAPQIRVSSYNDIGLYASLGLGYITSSNFLFELSWQMKQAKIKGNVYLDYIKIATIDVDQTINTLMFTVGFRL